MTQPQPQLPAEILERVRFDAAGLVPAVAQDAGTGEVLMLAWMNAEALATTLTTWQATYWSRSRGELWRKGETSGHTQQVADVALDCDGDTVLLQVVQVGPACHTGTTSCFTGRSLVVDAAPQEDPAEQSEHTPQEDDADAGPHA